MTEPSARYDAGPMNINPAARLRFGDPGYADPTPNDLRAVMQRARLTGSQVGDLVGVDSRTVRKWTGGERAMPYSAWRLLLLETAEKIDVVAPEPPAEVFRTSAGILFESMGVLYLITSEAVADELGVEGGPTDQQLSPHWPTVLRAARLATRTGYKGALVITQEELQRARRQ